MVFDTWPVVCYGKSVALWCTKKSLINPNVYFSIQLQPLQSVPSRAAIPTKSITVLVPIVDSLFELCFYI